MNVTTAKNFFSKHLSANNDFGVGDSRQEAKRVDTELGRIHDDTVDVKGELGRLDENSALKPPTFRDVSNKQLLVGTTTAGAVLGGTIGLINGMAEGAASATITETTVPIMEQRLDGAGINFQTYEYGPPEPAAPDGWDVEMTRRPLVEEKVGELTVREAGGSNASNIAVSGALGLVAGAAGGAVVGAAAIGLRKALNKDYNGAEQRMTEGDKNYIIGGAIAGATIGAAAGAISSLAQSSSTTFETETIAYETKVIGELPKGDGFAVPNNGTESPPVNAEQIIDWMNTKTSKLADRGFGNPQDLEPEEVTGRVPARTMFGNLDIETEEKTVSGGPGMLASVAGGAAVGAVTGVAGGVLVNVLRKTL